MIVQKHIFVYMKDEICMGIQILIFILIDLSYWELNEVQSPYVVGLNKRNDFCEN